MNGVPGEKTEKRSVLDAAARGIIKSRFVIFALFAAAIVYCVLSMGRTSINSDLTAFLPADSETRRGIAVMEEEFLTCGTANVMLEGVSADEAAAVAEAIGGIEHVAMVTFDGTADHFKDGKALIGVTFDLPKNDDGAAQALAAVRRAVSGYENYVTTDVGVDLAGQLSSEMTGIIIIAAVVIAAVLILTSRSYFDVVISGVVFVVAAILNMGTNFWLGEISSITNSVAVILQLALAIDYAIIFSHRYQDEAAAGDDPKSALSRALSRSIVEISSSGLTTISGLAALTFMRFRLGYDLGIVLAKGIVCSMLTVFLLMPGLISIFPRVLRATRHRSFIPRVEFWGRFLMKRGLVFLVIFAVVLPFAVVFSSRVEYAFSDGSITELVYSERREAMHKINDAFDPSTAMAVLVPAGDYQKEKELLAGLSSLDGIKSAVGLAGVDTGYGFGLTDLCSAAEFAAATGVDEAQAKLLFAAYGAQQGYTGDAGEYRAPVIDLILFVFKLTDAGMVELTGEQQSALLPLRPTLEMADKQLRGENYDRLALTSSLPAEGEESVALVERVREAAEKLYGEGTVLVTGDVTSARDLRDSYKSDSVLISILTIVFVFVILLFTFRSPVAAAVLVFVIQGSIWINFSFPYLTGSVPSFVTHMIVSAIQMGATIDYAIVIMNRYLVRRRELEPKAAMIRAVGESFPAVITSGAIMSVAGFLIAYRVSDVYVGHIGVGVGRGATISVILVLTVLPVLAVLCDKAIAKTTWGKKRHEKAPAGAAPDGERASG